MIVELLKQPQESKTLTKAYIVGWHLMLLVDTVLMELHDMVTVSPPTGWLIHLTLKVHLRWTFFEPLTLNASCTSASNRRVSRLLLLVARTWSPCFSKEQLSPSKGME